MWIRSQVAFTPGFLRLSAPCQRATSLRTTTGTGRAASSRAATQRPQSRISLASAASWADGSTWTRTQCSSQGGGGGNGTRLQSQRQQVGQELELQVIRIAELDLEELTLGGLLRRAHCRCRFRHPQSCLQHREFREHYLFGVLAAGVDAITLKVAYNTAKFVNNIGL